MLNQDGELNPHHHHHHHRHHHPPHHQHHPPNGRGPPRHRRHPPSSNGPNQSLVQSPGLGPSVASPRQDANESRDTEPHPVHQPRPAVNRYRRHGDPNPRLRRRQQMVEVQDSSPGADGRPAQAEAQTQEQSSKDPETDQSPSMASPHQTPVAVVTPTHLSAGAAVHNMPPTPASPSTETSAEHEIDCEEEPESVLAEDGEQERAEGDGDPPLDAGHSSCSCDTLEAADDKKEEVDERMEEDQEMESGDVVEDNGAQGSEITDFCSDTESAASLSMDGPLHSPPPLHSPTPPSSPDVPPFPQLDHFSEDTSLSPLPDNDLLPEEEEDNDDEEEEDCSESCSLSHDTSCSESYPKTYADFYSESHQKSCPKPVFQSHSEPKSHPNSFPEPLKTSYPELHREPRRQSGWRTEPSEAQQEPRQEPFTSHRHENVQRGGPHPPNKGSHSAPRHGRDRGSLHSPVDRSVGCRLHHYDGNSDGERDSADQSPVTKSHRQKNRKAETQARSPTSGWSSSGDVQEERNHTEPQGDDASRGSGDAITMAIKDIKEAIEEVKTKTVRSPYTPDKSVEPIWVMRQEVSPTEDVYSPQTTAGYVSMTSLSIRSYCFCLVRNTYPKT